MTKTLIIAEKPSVANDIAKSLGGFTKHDEYFESDDYVLSSAIGHLVEIAASERNKLLEAEQRAAEARAKAAQSHGSKRR